MSEKLIDILFNVSDRGNVETSLSKPPQDVEHVQERVPRKRALVGRQISEPIDIFCTDVPGAAQFGVGLRIPAEIIA
jgi:hypothetical protein